MKKAYINILLMILLTFFGALSTLSADNNQTLTLQQAINMALHYDFQLRMDSNNLEKSNLAVKQEVIKVFPQATIQGAYQYDQTSESYPSNYSIVISETIPTKANFYGQKVVTNIDAAVWDQVYNQAQYQITKANVIYNTTQKYLTVLKDFQILQLQETAVENAQTAYDLATEQLKYGKITKTSQLKADNDLNNATLLLEQDRANYEIALQQLGNQIGQGDLTQFSFIDVNQSLKMDPINPDQLKAQALKNRLEIQQAQITIRKAERTLAQTSNQRLPDLNLSYNNIDNTQSCSVSYDFLSGDIAWSGAQRQTNRPIDPFKNDNHFGNKDINYTLKLTWNLDFGIAANQVKQDKLTLENAKIIQQQSLQNVSLDVQQAISDYQLAVKKTATNQKLIPYFQKDLEIKTLQQKLGTATQLDVKTAQYNLSQAQIEVVKATYDQMIAYQKLQLAAGDLYTFDQKQ